MTNTAPLLGNGAS